MVPVAVAAAAAVHRSSVGRTVVAVTWVIRISDAARLEHEKEKERGVSFACWFGQSGKNIYVTTDMRRTEITYTQHVCVSMHGAND